MVTTVANQKKQFSRRDINRAEQAKRLQESLMYPSTKALLHMIDNNLITNCDVTRRDIRLALEIFGVNPNIVKGKMTRRQPGHVHEYVSAVPPEILKNYRNVTLGIDVYHVNGVKFLRSISRHLMFRITKPIPNAKEKTLMKNVARMISVYKTRGFNVTQIYGDNEFRCIEGDLEETLGVRFFPVARNAHEPFIERDGRTSKERCRCVFNSLPYTRWPTRMVMELPIAVDFFLNYWCSSGGVSATIPPRQILYGTRLNNRVHCRFQFGEYVLAHDSSDNTMKPRASDAIFLQTTGNPDGGFYVFDLKTARRVHRRTATRAHVTDTVINRVHEIARKQQAPEGINFGGFDEDTTIHDFDDQDVGSEDDDDDASDESYYGEAEDNDTVDTELTGVTSGSDSDAIEYHENQNDAINDEEDNQATINEDADTTNESSDIEHETEEVDTDVENSGVDDSEGKKSEVENSGVDDAGDESPVGNNELSDSLPEPRRTLRKTVQSRKYDESEGYAPTTRHRNGHVLFCAGYSKAVKRLEEDHHAIMLVGAAMELYNNLDGSMVTPQYGIKKGLKLFGKLGTEAVLKELKQLDNLDVIIPQHPRTLSRDNIRKALPYLMFLKRKRCGKIKARGCADGRSQRDYITKDEASSPTASIVAIMLTCLVDALEERAVGIVDLPGAFLQTEMPKDEDPTYIRIVGEMADLLVLIDAKKYQPHATKNKKGETVIYSRANKAIYGTLKAALLFWKKLKRFLDSEGFKDNPYDPCTMNKIINGKQATIQWYVDDVKISHAEEEVVGDIIELMNGTFGKVAPLTGSIAKVHEYLGMTIDYANKGRVCFSMFDYMSDIVDNLPEHLQTNRNTATPAADHLFDVNPDAEKLNAERAEEFHHYVAKLLFASKRARPDIQTAVAFLCTRVKEPDVDDAKKLIRLLGYVKDTLFLLLTIGSDGTGNMYWYVDASFAVHQDMKSHTGGVLTFGIGGAVCVSTKQKINTKSSTEAELVAVDDVLPHNLWCRSFLKAQGYHANSTPNNTQYIGHTNILYQDNTSSIKLETNGRSSCSKRTRHLNIRYFMVHDHLKRGNISSVVYCPTDDMLGNYLTKPNQGSKFRKFRNAIMGVTDAEYIRYKVEFENARNHKRQAELIASSS